MARFLILLLGGVLMASCSPPPTKNPDAVLPMAPKEGEPKVSDVAQRTPATAEQLKTAVDLEEYPGASVVENARLSSPHFSPDEARFELVRTSPDSPEKVTTFYEGQLKTRAGGKPEKKEIFGRTERGNMVHVVVESDGSTGSKYSLNIIGFMK